VNVVLAGHGDDKITREVREINKVMKAILPERVIISLTLPQEYLIIRIIQGLRFY